MHRSRTRRILAAITTVATIATASPLAMARSTSAFVGRPQNSSDAGCFWEWYGSLTNVCDTTKTLIVPLTVDVPGNHTIFVSAYGAGAANNVGCAAFGVNKEVTAYWGGVASYLSTFGASVDITLSGYVPPGGSLYVACFTNPQGRINMVNMMW
jgi:hypothetical protein